MTSSNRTLFIIGGVLLLILCCYCAAIAGVFSFLVARPTTQRSPAVVVTRVATVQVTRMAVQTPNVDRLKATPTPARSGTATAPLSSATAGATEAASPAAPAAAASVDPTAEAQESAMLAASEMPAADPRQLAMRFNPNLGEIPEVVNTTTPTYKVGDRVEFWVNNNDTLENQRVTAVLMYTTDHVAMWVQEGVKYNQSDLEASAKRFEEKTYPTNRAFFGSEWTPGVDDDPRLHILHARGLGDSVAGYYSSADEYSSEVDQYSNQKEMFYISAGSGGEKPNTTYYDGTLAHEFQHMIHWANDRNETSWVNEGMSELASYLNGFDPGFDLNYAQQPDTQLTTWRDLTEGNAEHYGASYLFMSYFLDRFGEDLTKAVVASPLNGTSGFDAALEAAGRPERFNDIFADWVVANYLDEPDADGEGRYGYSTIDTYPMAVAETYRSYPASDQARVSQYGVDYIRLRGSGPLKLTFQGATQAQLVAAEPEGKYSWWSNRGDQSDSTLTRSVDLRKVDTATLNFSTWYDIEKGWDYAYVSVSTDGGNKWTILPGQHTTTDDPVGNAFGPGWTGLSGGGDSAKWIDEKVDLTAYAGKEILLRFEMVTDDAVNRPGMLIDNLSIPEIDFKDDGESGEAGWNSDGWLLTDNSVEQQWLVQLVQLGGQQITVQRVTVGPDGRGELSIPDPRTNGEAVMMVSAIAPVTTETATYSYQIGRE